MKMTSLTVLEWTSPPDPQRPPFPYHDGLSLSIQRHIPPEPYGVGYKRGTGPKMADREEIIKFLQSKWCLEHPVADTAPHSDSTIHNLHIIGGIACRDGRGAQLVRRYLDNDKDQVYVAKIYDPLYYSFASKEAGLPVDVTWMADHDYSREAAAYEEFKAADTDGAFAPKYYGSWTFNMTLLGATRPVRMILMEYIDGISLFSLLLSKKVLRISPTMRLEIMAQALELESKALYYYVKHGDFAARNVILVGLDIQAQAIERVLLVNFNQSTVYTRENAQFFSSLETDPPICPRYRHWDSCPEEFYYWVPRPHRQREEAWKGWLKTRWENHEGWAGPTEGLKALYNFDDSVEIAPPAQDDKLPDFF